MSSRWTSVRSGCLGDAGMRCWWCSATPGSCGCVSTRGRRCRSSSRGSRAPSVVSAVCRGNSSSIRSAPWSCRTPAPRAASWRSCRVLRFAAHWGFRAAVVPSLPGAEQGQSGAADPDAAPRAKRAPNAESRLPLHAGAPRGPGSAQGIRWPRRLRSKRRTPNPVSRSMPAAPRGHGAGDGIRTRDQQLGRL